MWIQSSKTKKKKKDIIQILCSSQKKLTQSFCICQQDLRSSTEHKSWIPRITAKLETAPKSTHNPNCSGECSYQQTPFLCCSAFCSPEPASAQNQCGSMGTLLGVECDPFRSHSHETEAAWLKRNWCQAFPKFWLNTVLQFQIHLLTQPSSAFSSSCLQRIVKYQNTLISLCGEISILRALQSLPDNATANSLLSATAFLHTGGWTRGLFQAAFPRSIRTWAQIWKSVKITLLPHLFPVLLTCRPLVKRMYEKDADSDQGYKDIKASNQG